MHSAISNQALAGRIDHHYSSLDFVILWIEQARPDLGKYRGAMPSLSEARIFQKCPLANTLCSPGDTSAQIKY
jgi:hypothetical protein